MLANCNLWIIGGLLSFPHSSTGLQEPPPVFSFLFFSLNTLLCNYEYIVECSLFRWITWRGRHYYHDKSHGPGTKWKIFIFTYWLLIIVNILLLCGWIRGVTESCRLNKNTKTANTFGILVLNTCHGIHWYIISVCQQHCTSIKGQCDRTASYVTVQFRGGHPEWRLECYFKIAACITWKK